MSAANNFSAIGKSAAAIGSINKAWAAAIAAPLAEWLVGVLADALWSGLHVAMPDSAELALVSLIVGIVVYYVPNLPARGDGDSTEGAGA
ncbi:hypothetical protein [Dongia sp.]|uniref:hypothetical protein n=1 Tax=Dongia sp. TaxID=1977262 RepID=UPI0035ADAE3B